MKALLAQVNPRVGNVEYNFEKLSQVVSTAEDDQLIVFPEMFMTGYPLEDLVFSKDLQVANKAAVEKIPGLLTNTNKKVLVGFLDVNDDGRPFNSVALVSAIGVEQISHKLELPTYGVFDEKRLFTPGDTILNSEFQGTKFSVIICEDAWIANGRSLAQTRANNSEVLIVINGSPFEIGKNLLRDAIMKNALAETGVKTAIYLNLIGGQDDMVFDGGSFAFSEKGRVLQMPFFEENLTVFDTVADLDVIKPLEIPREEFIYRAATLGLRDYITKNDFSKVAIGVSGGIDSALVATMAADALGGENVFGYSLPSKYSSDHSLSDAEKLMSNLGGNYEVVPIAPMVEAFKAAVELTGIASENLQARVRGTTLMGISNQRAQLVLTPGNKSELAMGYSTIYGDTVGCYAPIKDIYKTDIFKLARWRNRDGEVIPFNSIEKPPSAELSPGQVDSDSLPPYDLLDDFLELAIEGRESEIALSNKFGEELTKRLLTLLKRAEWKRRQYPIGPKLTTMSFGRERLMPLTNPVSTSRKEG